MCKASLGLLSSNKTNKLSSGSWKCPFCTEIFPVRIQLTIHMSTQHGAKQELACEICGKLFKRADIREIHMNVHRGIYKYNCQICRKGFNVKVDLIGHVNKHQGIKTHFCTMCDASYFQRRPLMTHMRRVHQC